jgi:hypothetical protein
MICQVEAVGRLVMSLWQSTDGTGTWPATGDAFLDRPCRKNPVAIAGRDSFNDAPREANLCGADAQPSVEQILR